MAKIKQTRKAGSRVKPQSDWDISYKECGALIGECNRLIVASSAMSVVIKNTEILSYLTTEEIATLTGEAEVALGLLSQFQSQVQLTVVSHGALADVPKRKRSDIDFIELFATLSSLLDNFNNGILPTITNVLELGETASIRATEKETK